MLLPPYFNHSKPTEIELYHRQSKQLVGLVFLLLRNFTTTEIFKKRTWPNVHVSKKKRDLTTYAKSEQKDHVSKKKRDLTT